MLCRRKSSRQSAVNVEMNLSRKTWLFSVLPNLMQMQNGEKVDTRETLFGKLFVGRFAVFAIPSISLCEANVRGI